MVRANCRSAAASPSSVASGGASGVIPAPPSLLDLNIVEPPLESEPSDSLFFVELAIPSAYAQRGIAKQFLSVHNEFGTGCCYAQVGMLFNRCLAVTRRA